jgi:hypothetical protein
MSELPDNIWFVATKGWKVFPVHPKGWRLVIRCTMAVAFAAIAGVLLTLFVGPAVGIGLFVLVTIVSAVWFIATARAHADLEGRYAGSSWAR